MAKVGRPSIYAEKIEPYLDDIRTWRSQGWTLEKIAEALNVNRTVLWKHTKNTPELANTIKMGTAEMVINLENTAYSLAVGNFEQVNEEIIYGPNNQVMSKKIKRTKVQDTTALIFLLKSLAPEKYANSDGSNKEAIEAISKFANKYK